MFPAALTRSSPRRPHERARSAAARCAAVPRLRRRSCAPTALRSRQNRRRRSSPAIGLLGPRDLEDIRRAGLATLAPPPERRAAFDALFRHPFPRRAKRRIWMRAKTTRPGPRPGGPARRGRTAGRRRDQRIRARRRRARRRWSNAASGRLARTKRCGAWRARPRRRLPKRRSYRRLRARRGAVVDLRRTLREAARNDGEVISSSRLKRRMRPRKTAAADRRLRLDEGAHRRQSPSRSCADARRRRGSRRSPSARG